ncbi:anaerobic ribonucleoside-triphosphate reductase activating protein [Candidatus Micrarchaeota archaeon]|nr:anaerobic ribonucleoside-triphosphate reductase activating protein [Candidatus Micrarchaeota archaeon]
MNIAGFLPQSFCDWPGKTAAVIFTPGCNFRCGFCHNKELIEFKQTENEEIVLKKLSELKWSLDGVVITGGEPTLQPDLIPFLEKLKATGISVKLDTNGSNPNVLEEIIRKKLVNYIAMDLKTTFEKYPAITKYDNIENIKKSVSLIISSGVDHEFRTTVVPDVISKDDIINAVREIKGAKRYALQRFIPRNCLDEAYNAFKSPNHDGLVDIAKSLDFDGEIRIRDEHREIIFKKRT